MNAFRIAALAVALVALPAFAGGGKKVDMVVNEDGFAPATVKAKVGEPLTLSVTRKVKATCATEIVIKDYNVNTKLPLNETVAVTITPKKAGKIRFACGMDMIAGEIVAE
ncbi:MAG: cupredoxin domain-containing protein [Anaeromyxobacter sp.]